MQYNFVIFSLSPWNISYGCNIKDISLELSKQHKVLYIDVPIKRKERWFMKDTLPVREVMERTRTGKNLKQIEVNLWHYISDQILESVNSVPNTFLFDTLNSVNNKRFAQVIKKAIQEVGFSNYILINDNDVYNGLRLKELLKPPVYVYYLRDMLSAFLYWKKHLSRLEPKLIQEADLVITNSEYLSNYARRFNPMSFYVGQGCDVSYYLQKPNDLEVTKLFEQIPRPIVGYVGALNSERLDIELIGKLALRMPQTSFVLVGPEDEEFRESSLHTLQNVFFLGKKDVADLPKYIYGFDVAINPQKLNEITIGNYPRKIDEYLAVGAPVVATKTEAMGPFKDHVYLAENVDEYLVFIKRALMENSNEKISERRNLATSHTWENNVAEILRVLAILR